MDEIDGDVLTTFYYNEGLKGKNPLDILIMAHNLNYVDLSPRRIKRGRIY